VGAIKLIKLRFDNPKLFAFTLAIAVLASSYFSYALTNNAVIHNSATISISSITAKSGSPADIQAAVNTMAAAGGGTVYIPAGTYYWNGETVTSYGGVSIIGASNAGCQGHVNDWAAYTATTILHNNAQPTSAYHPPTMFYLYGANGKASRISGIQFEATGPLNSSAENTSVIESAIQTREAKNVRIDHCTMINFCYLAINMWASTSWWQSGGPSSYGLIDHCVIDNPYKDTPDPLGNGWLGGYGVDAEGNMASSTEVTLGIQLYAGKYQSIPDVAIMYIEDCHFSRCRHAIDANAGAVVVTRFSLFDNPAKYQLQSNNIGEIDSHGGGWGSPTPAPTVCVEAYNNTITGKASFATTAMRIRGGSGLFYNNHFHPPDTAGGSQLQTLLQLDTDNTIPEYQVTQTYIWNNDYSNCYFIWNSAGRTLNTDYFLRAPSQGLDGWTYTPYTYPIATG